jgi:hypothetical protein
MPLFFARVESSSMSKTGRESAIDGIVSREEEEEEEEEEKEEEEENTLLRVGETVIPPFLSSLSEETVPSRPAGPPITPERE